jgi:hypothetical protein
VTTAGIQKATEESRAAVRVPGVRTLLAMLAVPWTRLLVYYVLLGGLLVSVAAAAHATWLARRAAGYVSASATVITSETHQPGGSDGKVLPVLVAEYLVGRSTHRVALVPAHGVEGMEGASAAELVERYPKGAEITVYHDPADPARALFNRHPSPARPLGGAAVVLVVLGVVAFVDGRRVAMLPRPEPALDPEERRRLVEVGGAALRAGLRLALLGVPLWPFALVAWQKRATARAALLRAGESVPALSVVVACLVVVGLLVPLALVGLVFMRNA